VDANIKNKPPNRFNLVEESVRELAELAPICGIWNHTKKTTTFALSPNLTYDQSDQTLRK